MLNPRITFLFRNLAADASAHEVAYHARVLVVSLQEHELRDGALHGAVAAAHHASVLQLEARVVATHLHESSHALADVHNRHAALRSVLQQTREPRLLRSVAAAETSHHDAAQLGCVEHVARYVLLNAGEEREHHHVRVHRHVRNHRLRVVGLQDVVGIEVELYARLAQVRIVERVECVESVGALLRTAVAAQQSAAEVDAHLRHHRVSVLAERRRQFDTRQQVLLAVGAELSDRQLRTGQNHRLREVLEHERERRCRVRHSVGAVQHHESVVFVVVVGYDAYKLSPSTQAHVR